MSNQCGNRFLCGIRRFDKHSTLSDKSSNNKLFLENKTKLDELIKIRETQDKGLYNIPIEEKNEISLQYSHSETVTDDSIYTSWKTPSSYNINPYDLKSKSS